MEEKLVTENIGLVRYVAYKYLRFAKIHRLDFDDLVSIGTFGLIKAARNFDPNRGVVFASFATVCIKNELALYFRKANRAIRMPDRLPVSMQETVPESDSVLFEEAIYCDEDFTSAEVNEFIESLPNRDQRIVEMLLADYTQKEIGRELGVTQTHVSRLIKRIGRKLEEKMAI